MTQNPAVASPARPRQRRPRRFVRAGLGYLVGLAILAAAWQIIGTHTPPQIFVPLGATFSRLGELFSSGDLPDAMAQSFSTLGVGLCFALVVGTFAGLLFARIPLARKALEPYAMSLYALPLVALIPFILALLGYGFWPKCLVVGLFAFFPIMLNTERGALSVSATMLDVARVYHSTERQTWQYVIIPHTLPYFMTGIGQALAQGLVGMVAADVFLSANGLGGLLLSSSQLFDTAGNLAVILVIAAAGIILMALGRLIGTRVVHWQGKE